MALELGGRADKSGNQYENHFLGKQLLLLAEGKLKTVEVEPLGEEGTGVEFVSEKHGGGRIYYQCKAGNGSNNSWSISALARHKVFKNAKQHILRSIGNEFHFISPLSYNGLNDLCDRARKNHSGKDFLSYQVTNDQLRAACHACELQFGLSKDNEDELNQLVHILSKCYFDQVINTQESLQDAEDRIEWYFTGSPKSARLVLENHINDSGKYGIALSNYDVVRFMADHGYYLRDYGKDEAVAQRIKTLNEIYWGEYLPINGSFFPREAANQAINHLMDGNSVVLHGKAGAGKSGCVELVSQYLDNNQIPYLRIKLDKNIPCHSSVQFGRDLELPDSPVRCLQKLSGGKLCVLILDQLDALRWTASHSPTAIAVCKELLTQVKTARANYGAQITVLFVTRTFDYKTDARIRNLVANDSQLSKTWYEVEVSNLSDLAVSEIVGNEYTSLSQKLKVMLRNPASLFVWTQLDQSRRSQVITSANQLICKWWEQNLERCEQKGLSSIEVNKTIKDIAQKMGNSSAFFLPRISYPGQKQVIDALISEGMLIEHSSKLAFSHQIFLDYFIVSDQLEQLACGKPMLELLGSLDNQTPNLRYRFLVLLQELYDLDETLFMQQSKFILESDNVRFYYKCAVFEAIGQCADPSDIICNFVSNYWHNPIWHEYVRQVVCWGNQSHISFLLSEEKIECLSPDGIWLLRSICESHSDFVADIIKPHCSKSPETDRKILSCLCVDADSDSDEMFKLRLDILNRHPEFLSENWACFYHLFKNGSSRMIDYMSLLIANAGSKSIENIHFPEMKELEKSAKANYQEIVAQTIPQLCATTAGLAKDVDRLWYSDEFSRWNAKDSREGVLRKIVHISKTALIEFARKAPHAFLQTLLKDEYSASLVGNELILSALSTLSADYANCIIRWLTLDFPTHLFNYTGNRPDYLATTKQILKNFSSSCSADLFALLEANILHWCEPANRMIDRFKYRLDMNKSKEHSPVYYAYWGFLQKELLPCLDARQTSPQTKELIGVLERNEWIHVPHYSHPWSMSVGKGMSSPVSRYVDKISDKTWLQIIRTPASKMTGHKWQETRTAYIEATHSSFSQSLSAQARKQPARFARLSLNFPEHCFPSYITGVLQALQHKDSTDEIASTELTCDVIRKYAKSNNIHILECIAEIIAARAEENWPEDILAIVQNIALIPVSKDTARVVLNTDANSAHELYMQVLNTTQGNAIRAISSLLFKKSSLLGHFKSTISALSLSTEPFVLLAVVDCCVACYNDDKEYACNLFRTLIQKEKRVLIADHAWEIIGRDYSHAPNLYRECLISAMQTNYIDLGERAAHYLCAASIYQNDAEALRFILESPHPNNQVASICRQAVHCFEYDLHRDISKEIILHMIRNYSLDCYVISSDFLKKNIVIERDKDFLLKLIASNKKIRMMSALLEYLSETEENIIDFAEVIHAISKHLTELHDEGYVQSGIEDMIHCIVHLYDVGKDDPRIKTICLDAWDELFKNNLHDIKSLATILDNFS